MKRGIRLVKVLIIEDDNIIGEMLRLYLQEEGYLVERAATAQEGFSYLKTYTPDVILLDLILPDAIDVDLCAAFRQQTSTPIIVVSMKNETNSRIHALQVGADDYLSKPFSMQELKARIQAVLRRIALSSSLPPVEVNMPKDMGIYLDEERRLIMMEGNSIETTYSEYEIMKLLLKSPERVFSRDELINAIRGFDSFINDRSIDVHVTNLRKKIEEDPKSPRYIKTVWGVGYKFIQ